MSSPLEIAYRLPISGFPRAVFRSDYGYRGGRLVVGSSTLLAAPTREALEAGVDGLAFDPPIPIAMRLVPGEDRPRLALVLGGRACPREDNLSATPSRSAWLHASIALLGSLAGFAASAFYLRKANLLNDVWALKMGQHMAAWHALLVVVLFPASVWGQRIGIRAVQLVSLVFFCIHIGIALANSDLGDPMIASSSSRRSRTATARTATWTRLALTRAEGSDRRVEALVLRLRAPRARRAIDRSRVSRAKRSVLQLQRETAMQAKREIVPGSGLSLTTYAAILALSIALFLFWSGPLWSAAPASSHVARFVVSYLAVVPIAALALRRARRLDAVHLFTAVGSIWAIKMVATVVLYEALARSTASQVAPIASHTANRPELPAYEYRAADGDFASVTLSGRVTRGGRAVAGAIVYLVNPSSGVPAPEPRRLTLSIEGSKYVGSPLYAIAADTIAIKNDDHVLHTAHVAGSDAFNRPIPSGATVAIPAEPGVRLIECDNHPGERALIVVVDHPYVTKTDASGAFSIERAPRMASAPVAAVALEGSSVRRAQATAHPGAPIDLDLDLGIPVL